MPASAVSNHGSAATAKPALERAVLGAALRSQTACEQLLAALVEQDFFLLDHQSVFVALQESAERGPIDQLDIASTLEDLGVPDPYGMVNSLVGEAALDLAVERHLTTLKASSQGRQLAAQFAQFATKATHTGGDPLNVAALLSEAADAVRDAEASVQRTDWLTLEDVAATLTEEEYADPVMPTGFTDLDNLLNGGVRPGQVAIVAARPSVGKSTIAMDMCRHATIGKDHPGMLLSLEMTRQEMGGRLMSAESSVPLQSIQNNAVSLAERAALERTSERIAGSELYFVDKVPGQWPAVKALIIRAVRRLKLEYVVLDYLQLLDDGTNNPSREQVIANISRQFKMLVSELGIAGVLLSQLNRGPENRSDKRPAMSDLRESGSLEQDADIVMLLFRPDMVDQMTDRVGQADVDVVKNRGGERGRVLLAFQGDKSRFVNFIAETNNPYA